MIGRDAPAPKYEELTPTWFASVSPRLAARDTIERVAADDGHGLRELAGRAIARHARHDHLIGSLVRLRVRDEPWTQAQCTEAEGHRRAAARLV